MSFRVKNEAVDAERLLVVTEEQVKIFKCFAQKERLHHVARFRLRHALHVSKGTVAVFHLGKLFESLDRTVDC